MENLENYNYEATITETTETAAAQTAPEEEKSEDKKFGVGEYAVLASAIVGVGTMCVGAYKASKKAVRGAKTWFAEFRNQCKKKRAEAEAAKEAEKKPEETPALPEKTDEEKKD